MADSHSLRRTSPKGGPFVGTCIKCGKPNIPLAEMRTECVNPAGLNNFETLQLAIRLVKDNTP
jgi:hypothetical protein